MNFIHNRWRRAAALLLVLSILYPSFYASGCLAEDNLQFLNDRASEIVNSSPLSGMDILNPGELSGQGQIIGIADSGLDKGSTSDIHPDLQSDSGKMPRVVMLKSYSGREIPDDPSGHGTHMAATIAGSGAASEGLYRGIAYGASIYFQALLDEEDALKVPDDIEELFYPAYQAGVRTHVNGWGRQGNYYASISSQIDEFVYDHQDFLPLFGAGNSGPDLSSLTSEANSKNALAIGSSQVPRPALSPDADYSDQPASSSSLGPAGDGRIKPELFAPGSAVVSSCSTLVESNYDANEMYTIMGGSSMATAVAGGCIAILREYLEKKLHMEEPPAALIKALLVNGARTAEDMPSASKGFGILDLAGSILALEENSFTLQEDIRLREGDIKEYSFVVTSSSEPFKATLAWTDPPAASGTTSALINNLDLVVKGPNGKLYYGNDFNSSGQADSVNNTEQVYIPSPAEGKYTIIVRGSEYSSNYTSQKFSLVYGQALEQDTMTSIDEKQIELADNKSILLEKIEVKSVIQDGVPVTLEDIQVGSQIYRTAGNAVYIFGSSWEVEGAQMISTASGNLLMEANSSIREGGYYVDPRESSDNEGKIMVNGNFLQQTDEFPTGAQLKASVNPLYQTLWQISADYQEVSGYIASFDPSTGLITLIHNEKTYILTSWAAGNITSQLVDSTAQDAPYGYGEKVDLQNLLPGMKATLVLSPGTNMINYVKVERQFVIGSAAYIDAESEIIRMETGSVYHLFPGTVVTRDGETVSLDMLSTGDFIAGLLLPGTNDFLKIEASSNTRYGRVIYCNSSENIIYFMDSDNKIVQAAMTEETGIFHRGGTADRTSLVPGSWVRLNCGTDDELVQRIDIADVDKEVESTFVTYHPESRMMEMADGSQYYYTESTLLSKNGYCLMPEDLLPGEKVRITTLYSADITQATPAAIEVVTADDANSPELNITMRSLNGALIVKGYSSANRIILYREDNTREVIETDSEGQFSAVFKLLDNETMVKALALNTITGDIYGVDVEIQAYPVETNYDTFSDIVLHPAREQIEELASRGAVRGYEDGTFRPDQPITRVEFIKIITVYLDWNPSGRGGVLYTDYNDIPWWALGAVNTATEHGLIEGYPDGSFKPFEELTQSEIAVILDRLFSLEDDNLTAVHKYTFSIDMPEWAQESVARGFERGVLSSVWADGIKPDQAVTRAEAAAFLLCL